LLIEEKQTEFILLETNCPYCSSFNKNNLVKTKDYEMDYNVEFTVSVCIDCGFIYTSIRPEEEVLYKVFYPDNYLCYGVKHKKGLACFIDKVRMGKQAKERASLIKKYFQKKNIKILEVGSATGEFLQFVKNNYGWESEGIEPNEQLAIQCKQEGLNIINSTLENASIKDDYYDVICLFNVLEHLWDPKAALIKLNKSLKKDGIIIAELPNPNSPMRTLFGKHWFLYHLPRHLSHFSEKSLANIMQKTGFYHLKTFKMFRPTVNALSFQYKIKDNIKSKIIKNILNTNNPLIILLSLIVEIINNLFYDSNIVLSVFKKEKTPSIKENTHLITKRIS